MQYKRIDSKICKINIKNHERIPWIIHPILQKYLTDKMNR